MPELDAVLAEVLQQFMNNLQNGGIQACRQMVADLGAEADMSRAVTDGIDDARSQVIMYHDSMSTDDLNAQLETINGVAASSTVARSRYSFACFLLQQQETQQA